MHLGGVGSHFHSFPAEILDDILSRVFRMLLGEWQPSWNAFVALRDALRLICRRWDDVICGSVRYWTMLSISRYSNTEHLLALLSRSKLAPLRLVLDLIPVSTPAYYSFSRFLPALPANAHPPKRFINVSQAELCSKVMPILFTAFSRITVLEVFASSPDCLHEVVSQMTGHTALLLNRVVLRLPMQDSGDLPLFETFVNWPSLCDLSLKSVLPFKGDKLTVYGNLTVLRMYHISTMLWDDLADALESAHVLELLQLESVECDNIGHGQFIRLSTVTHLFLTYRTRASVLLAALVDMPALTSLRVTTYGASINLLVTHCEKFICCAQSVDIAADRGDMEEFTVMLRLLANVCTLDLRRSSAAVFTALSVLLTEEDIRFPNLSMIIFTCELTPEDAGAFLRSLVPPRVQLGCRLVAGLAGTAPWDRPMSLEWSIDDEDNAVYADFDPPPTTPYAEEPSSGLAWGYMRPLLSNLKHGVDFSLGAPRLNNAGSVVSWYLDTHTGEDLVCRVLGEVIDIVEIEANQRLLMLASPERAGGQLRQVFFEQTLVLDAALLFDRMDSSRLKQHVIRASAWSQGPAADFDGYVYVVINQDTCTSQINYADYPTLLPAAAHIPLTHLPAGDLDLGAFVDCEVELTREDEQLRQLWSANGLAYSRVSPVDPVFIVPLMSLRESGVHFNDLPTEIIDDIIADLLDALLGDWYSSWNAFVALREALCLLCHRWKDVIFGSAQYWSTIVVHCFSNTGYLLLQLARAKSAPLSLTVDLVPDGSPSRYEFVRFVTPFAITSYTTFVNLDSEEMKTAIMPAFAEAYGRIRELEVASADAVALKALVDEMAQYPAAMLRRASFKLARETTQQSVFKTLRNWSTLEELNFRCILAIEINNQSPATTLSTLRLHHVGNVTWACLSGTLLSLANLRVLHLVRVECINIHSARQILLPSVTHLVLGYRSEVSVMVVAYLDIPNIRSFRGTTYGSSIGLLADYCVPLLCNAASVDLSVEQDDMEGFAVVLPLLSSAEVLDLRRSSPAVLESFVELLNDPEFSLPRLQMLKFFCDIRDEMAGLILTQLVPHRFPPRCRLIGGLAGTGGWDPLRVIEWHMDASGRVNHIAHYEAPAQNPGPWLELAWRQYLNGLTMAKAHMASRRPKLKTDRSVVYKPVVPLSCGLPMSLPLLSDLVYVEHFVLGPETLSADPLFYRRRYQHVTGSPVVAIVVGLIREITTVRDGRRILLLTAPVGYITLEAMFARQVAALDDVLARDRTDTPRVRIVISQCAWCQTGFVHVNIGPSTSTSRRSDTNGLGSDVTAIGALDVEVGALVFCEAVTLRNAVRD
ncbi:hypothetical protein C8R44DRAFT_737557 [Mycena epipterygia]|nr:hypothetical protein C8R44DRAFT_737557 [Mycena epipterygia]